MPNKNNYSESVASALPKKNNNVDKSLLLDVKNLTTTPHRVHLPSDDHKIGFDDKTSLTKQEELEIVQTPPTATRYNRDVQTSVTSSATQSTSNVQNKDPNVQLPTSCYQLATLRRSAVSSDETAIGYHNPKSFYTKSSFVQHNEPRNKSEFRPAEMIQGNASHIQCRNHLSQNNPYSSQATSSDLGNRSSSHKPIKYRVSSNAHVRNSTNQRVPHKMTWYNAQTQSRPPSALGNNEHEYEDICYPMQGDQIIRPIPKPRLFVQQCQKSTMQIRIDTHGSSSECRDFSTPQERKFSQRRYSDGLVNESAPRPLSARYDVPIINPQLTYRQRGDIERNNKTGNASYNPPYVSTGDLRIFSSNQMLSIPHTFNESPREISNTNNGGNAYSRQSNQSAFISNEDTEICADMNHRRESSKRRRASVGSGRFPFRRNSKSQIYRNTDIPRFDVECNASSRHSATRLKTLTLKRDQHEMSIANSYAGSGTPKSDKLFGRRKFSELKGENETQVDVSLWKDRDDVFEDRNSTKNSKSFQSSNHHGSSLV